MKIFFVATNTNFSYNIIKHLRVFMTVLEKMTSLGLSFNDSEETILEVWNLLCPTQKTQETRLLIKALLDPYYHQTLQHYPDLNQLLPAGFFDDTLAPSSFDYKEDLFCTPIYKILHRFKELKKSKKPFVVMLNTGSYSPIHFGHLQMMESAYEILSEQYTVLGGYFSPSHDKYVSTKYSGSAAYNSDARIDLCENFIYKHNYLMIDPWEARYNNVSINFTNVIIHLKKLLKKYLPVDVQIAYVFGSDNAGFGWAFVKDDISVCFERPGYELAYQIMQQDHNKDNQRHFFINHKENFYSSKSIREGSHHFLSDKIKNLYFQYKNNQYPIYSNSYLIRDDSSYCIKNLYCGKEQLSNFKANLINIFKKAFLPYSMMNILLLDIEKQNKYLNSEYFSDKHILNADLWTHHPQQYTLDITRLFYLSDGQVSSEQLIPRIGKKSIEEQVSSITHKHLTFVDDDIASGKTFKMVSAMLQPDYVFDELIALSQQSFYEEYHYDQSYNFHDIVDFRDFLIGSSQSGLTVELPDGTIGKAPYVWPYVSLSHRAKIPHVNQRQFSLDVWQLNKEFYSYFPSSMLVKDLDSSFVSFVASIGLDVNMTMVDFCQLHIVSISQS